MKQKTLLIMTLLSTLLGCGNKISGPDFDHQENKVIVLNETFRIDYQIPGNLSQLMGFEEEYKKQPKSININNISNLKFEDKDWKKFNNLDGVMWEYYRGKRNIEKNRAAEFSIDIDIHSQTKNTQQITDLKTLLQTTYEDFLNGTTGINTKTRKRHPELTDDDLGPLVIHPPEFDITNFNEINFIHWEIYGELKGWNLEYFAIPIDKNYYLTFLFSYYYVAKNEKELSQLETMLKNDVNKFMEQIQISRI